MLLLERLRQLGAEHPLRPSAGMTRWLTSTVDALPGPRITGAAALVAMFAGLSAVFAPYFLVAVLSAVAGTLVVAWLAQRTGIVLALILPVLLAGLMVPRTAELAAEGALAVFAFTLALEMSVRSPPTAAAALTALAVLGFWVVLAFHPNVPSVALGLVGVRKTAFVFAGLAIGILWPRGRSTDVESLIVRLLWIAAVACLVVHLLAPGFEASFGRNADVWTGQFAGHTRMSGFFGGPFHVSLLGSFLVIWGWHAYLSRLEPVRMCLAFIVTGLALLTLAEVRSGFVAVAVAAGVTIFLHPGVRSTRIRVAGATVVAASVAALILSSSWVSNSAISSIPHLGQDTRALGRLDYWQNAISLIKSSPLIGWGAGAAGATLDQPFFLREHVTAHNMVLGFLVEGGVVGLFLVFLAWLSFSRIVKGGRSLSHPAAAAAIALASFGLSGDISEALPVSLFLMILIGLRGRLNPPQQSEAS